MALPPLETNEHQMMKPFEGSFPGSYYYPQDYFGSSEYIQWTARIAARDNLTNSRLKKRANVMESYTVQWSNIKRKLT